MFAFFPIKNTHIYTVEPSRSRPCDFHRVSLIQASKGQLTDFVAMRHRVRWSTLGMETQIRRKDDGISGTYENNKHFFNVEGSPGRFPLCNYIIFLRFQLLGINDLPQSNFAVTQTACFCLTTIIKSLPMHFSFENWEEKSNEKLQTAVPFLWKKLYAQIWIEVRLSKTCLVSNSEYWKCSWYDKK